jgi:hypothetical protein
MRSRKTSRAVLAVTAAGLLTLTGALPAAATTAPDPMPPETPALDEPEIPETVLGALLNDVLVAVQDLLPGLVGGVVPAPDDDPAEVAPAAAAND